jgi:hypothetical protein
VIFFPAPLTDHASNSALSELSLLPLDSGRSPGLLITLFQARRVYKYDYLTKKLRERIIYQITCVPRLLHMSRGTKSITLDAVLRNTIDLEALKGVIESAQAMVKFYIKLSKL